MDAFTNAKETLAQLQKGAFLTAGEQPNPMTIGWGSLSVYWGKPIFIVPVRESRHTFSLLNRLPYFTVSVPAAGQMQKELAFCGSHSGRSTNKWEAAPLTQAPSTTVPVPVVANCSFYYECRVLLGQDLELPLLEEAVRAACYPKGDAHRLYFGEILAAYGNM